MRLGLSPHPGACGREERTNPARKGCSYFYSVFITEFSTTPITAGSRSAVLSQLALQNFDLLLHPTLLGQDFVE